MTPKGQVGMVAAKFRRDILIQKIIDEVKGI